MSTVCKACNSTGYGMIHIYSHPNNIDEMFTSLTGIEIIENDCLCIPCYDDMKIANSFRQKCLQSDLIRKTAVEPKVESPNLKHDVQEKALLNEQDEINLKEHEITTTSISDNIEIKEEFISESVEFPVENTTRYIRDINGELEDKEVEYENDDTDALMIDYQELDKDFDNGDINDESDDAYRITSSLIWKCIECNKSFARKGNFQKHIKVHLNAVDNSIKSKIIKKHGQVSKYYEEDIFQDIHETQCQFCFLEFGGAQERLIHEVSHNDEEKPYKCPIKDCTSQFKEKYGLRNHIRIHSDYKRYKCRYCDHRFHQRGNIISHERLHTGEKPFLCPHCGKAFAESGNLKAHIRFHTGERPYTCSICEKSFTTHYTHKIHVRTHTKERPYLCSECGKSFSSSGKLLVHKRIHTGQRPYKCFECPSAFVHSTGLKRHLKIHISKATKK